MKDAFCAARSPGVIGTVKTIYVIEKDEAGNIDVETEGGNGPPAAAVSSDGRLGHRQSGFSVLLLSTPLSHKAKTHVRQELFSGSAGAARRNQGRHGQSDGQSGRIALGLELRRAQRGDHALSARVHLGALVLR